MSTVIIFGPTGGVGSFVATSAHEHGAKVVLAMRDTSKSIPGLTAEQEKAGNYQRVQADLLDPDSVSKAIKSTGATGAYFYHAAGSPDHMKATIEAMKAAGITLAVFLSTSTVTGAPQDSSKSFIPYAHAQVELALDSVFGKDEWLALRPGAFATNLFVWQASHLTKGEIKMYNPDLVLDNITPEDMGAVSGSILVKGKPAGVNHIFIYGPEQLSQREGASRVSKVVGRDLKQVTVDTVQEVLPPFLPAMIQEALGDFLAPPKTGREVLVDYDIGVSNIEKYAGRPAMKYDDWLLKNKDKLLAAIDGKA